jgi:hypothetical protein
VFEIGIFWESELGFEIKLFLDLNKAKLRVFKGDRSKFKVVATILKTLDTEPPDNDFLKQRF